MALHEFICLPVDTFVNTFLDWTAGKSRTTFITHDERRLETAGVFSRYLINCVHTSNKTNHTRGPTKTSWRLTGALLCSHPRFAQHDVLKAPPPHSYGEVLDARVPEGCESSYPRVVIYSTFSQFDFHRIGMR